MKLEEARKISVTDEIVKQIKLLIDNGELKPGDKLPSQKEMEAIFNVSRPTLQKAISKLATLGLIDAIQGKGYYIKYVKDIIILPNIPPAVSMNESKFSELYEAKMYFEATLARLAARNATDDEIVALNEYVDSMEKNALDNPDPGESGNKFHSMVADLAHNRVLADFEKSLLQLLEEYEHNFVKCNRNTFNKYEYIPHKKIVQAIQSRNEDQAYIEAFNHVLNYIRDIGLKPLYFSQNGTSPLLGC